MCRSLVLFVTVLAAAAVVYAAPNNQENRDSRIINGLWPYGGVGAGGAGAGTGFLSSLPWPFGSGTLLSALSGLGDIELPLSGTPLGAFAPVPLPPLIGGPAQQLLNRPIRFGKPGVCPYVNRLVPTGANLNLNLPASVCGNLCFDDSSCPLAQKCCPHECGYSCFNPVTITN